MKALKIIAAFIASVVVTTLLGSVLQTQFNLGQLAALGLAVPLEVRLDTTAKDLASFTPSFAPLVAAGFLIAFLATALLRRWVTRGRTRLYTLAGATAIAATLLIMNSVFGITAVAASRTFAGFACLVLTGAVGGFVFASVLPITRSNVEVSGA